MFELNRMKYRMGFLMGALLVVVALPVRAQTPDIAAIMARMQEIITEMQSLQAEFAALSESIGTDSTAPAGSNAPAPAGSVLGAATTVLQEEAVYGNDNDTIARIQTLLATDPLIYADGRVTGFFGPLTEEALKNLQARFGMDPVGVVGPSTAELLMEYFVAYPGGSYPSDVLSARVTARAAGAQTSAPTPAPAPAETTSADNPIERIYLTRDDDETLVRVTLKAGGAFGLIANTRDEDALIEAIAERGNIAERYVAEKIDMGEMGNTRSRESEDDQEYDEDDAEDMLDEARNAIRDARAAIRAARDIDGDIEEADERYDEARDEFERAEEDFDDEDWDDAYKNAEDALELAEKAEDLAKDAAEIDEDTAEDMIDKADDAIDDAEDRIDAARDDGDDVDEAEGLLNDAKNKLDDAEEDFDDEDWEDAYERAKRAKELAEEAEDAL
jgi:peptidoglycan hydrolase-like protein with peptidoglycan-binding domain